MSRPVHTENIRAAPIFKSFPAPNGQTPMNTVPSSSPAFATPVHPIRPFNVAPIPTQSSILSIILPPATLRPLAFRTFTKKHSLTLTSSALQVLANFIGRHCGTEWRESGLAEPVLEEVARNWKNRNGGVIVNGEGNDLKDILESLEANMMGGRIVPSRELSRHNSLALGSTQHADVSKTRLGLRQNISIVGDSQTGLGIPDLDIDEDEENIHQDIRKWLRVIDAFQQPRLVYNASKKHFERDTTKPSLFPPASHRTQAFRNRYNLIHQRLMRNEAFQAPAFEASAPSKRSASGVVTTQQSYKLTPIANLLGRNGTNHMILGLLVISPTGTLAINDLTGSIALDLTHASPVPEDGAWFSPGMIVLVDGAYEEEDSNFLGGLAGLGGIGGSIGGKFIGFFIGGPPCERRKITLGLTGADGEGGVTAGGGFGWVDFLGVGSERAVGSKMRKIEQRLLRQGLNEDDLGGRARMVIIGEVNLDLPRTLQALRKVLGIYATEPEEIKPIVFILMGNFVQHAIMARGGSGGSIEYKEYFDSLALTLSEYPTLLQAATFVFVPGDNDGWVSSFTAGAATPLPRTGIPDIFTSRVKRAFAMANTEASRKSDGEAIWTSNPSRVSLFGPTHDIVLLRDNIMSRLRRSAIRFARPVDDHDEMELHMMTPPAPDSLSPSTSASPRIDPRLEPKPETDPDLNSARKLVKTILDQGHLSPFNVAKRPVHWDYASVLDVYPVPTAMVLADADAAPFCVTYEGCHVMNPGSLVARGRRGVANWVEYDFRTRIGRVRDLPF